jgi:hypothetical protein
MQQQQGSSMGNSGSMSPNSPISPASPPQHIVVTQHLNITSTMAGQGGLLSASANANMLSALQVSSSALQSNNKSQMRKSATIQNHQQTTAAATTTTVAANSGSGATATATAAVEYIPQEVNVLLDPEIINDYPTQALVLTVLATLVRNTTDENEIRVLYQYIAEASIVFPKGRQHF